VRDLVARRVPMFEFAIRSALEPYDLDSAEGRVAALRRAVPMVASIRDRALRPEYTKRLAGWLGMDIEPVAAAVAGVAGRTNGEPAAVPADKVARPDPLDPALQVEREALKLGLQVPQLAGPVFDATEADMYTADAYRSVRLAIAGAGGVATATSGPGWVAAVRESAPDDAVRTLVTELAVEPVRSAGDPDLRYTSAVLARLAEMAMTRRITELKSKLQRTNPLTAEQEYNRLFGELIALESQARGLRERAIGAL